MLIAKVFFQYNDHLILLKWIKTNISNTCPQSKQIIETHVHMVVSLSKINNYLILLKEIKHKYLKHMSLTINISNISKFIQLLIRHSPCHIFHLHKDLIRAFAKIFYPILHMNICWCISFQYLQIMQKLVKTGKYTEIKKQSDVKFWLNWKKYGTVSYSFTCKHLN